MPGNSVAWLAGKYQIIGLHLRGFKLYKCKHFAGQKYSSSD